MSKVGILGGTFNPIHLGHISLAEAAYHAFGLDKVLIIPTGLSYLKIGQNVLSKDMRAEMVKLAIKDYPYFEFSDIEIKKEGNTYTFETLAELKKLYTNDEFYFIIGADTLFSIENWKNPELIFDKCIVSVMCRDDVNIDNLSKQKKYLEEKYCANIEIINSPKVDISSTEIRNMISLKQYDAVRAMLSKDVLEYIILNKLYN